MISSKLIFTKFESHEELVGINSRFDELRLLLDIESSDVRMIGIWGMGGLGKTTIARVVYDLISREFEASCFLADVREISEKDGLISLQKQLLSKLLKLQENKIWNVYEGINMIGSRLQHKRVLLVIDDVVDIRQLQCLARKHDWFGSGSRIIITARDKHLLITHGVDAVYKLDGLNTDEALRLFCMKAFKTHKPRKEYEHLSEHIVEYAAGLPLALRVLGSFLFGRTIEEWESALKRLERDSANEILEILQISFEGLEETEKKIFLDIVCFFKGMDKDYVTKILSYCEFDPIIGIGVLIEKSLVSILDLNVLWVHDLLQVMGRQIVKRQCPEEPGKRSRLWKKEDIDHVLTKNTGTEAVEAIMLDYFPKDELHLSVSAKTFSNMTNLRLLMIHGMQLSDSFEYFSNELRFLHWYKYPLKSLLLDWQMNKIFELNICHSRLEQMWKGIKPLNNLKIMTLSHSKKLIRTPDFTGVPNLEELFLECCTSLREIHPSLIVHKKIILLSMKRCTSLTILPSKIAMESLREFVLSNCSKLRKFPEIVGSMKYLSNLLLDGTAIKALPLSIKHLSGLVLLDLKDCKNLQTLPSAIVHGFQCLKTLNLSGCLKLENVLENLEKVHSLEELDISGTTITQPLSSIFLLKNLKKLSLSGCKGPPALTSWFSFSSSRILEPVVLMLPSFSSLRSLWKLDLSDCNIGEGVIPTDIGNLLSLLELNLSKNNFVSLPGTINCLSELKCLKLEDCKKLQYLPELPSSLMIVKVDGCASLETFSVLKSYNSISYAVDAVNCLKLFSNNNLAFAMLKGFLESNPKSDFNIVFPGSTIPEWFQYQHEGTSTTVKDISDICYNKVVGYAICCVFHVHKPPPTVKTFNSNPTYELRHHMTDHKNGFSFVATIDFEPNLGQALSEHVYLYYKPEQKYRFDSFTSSYDSRSGLEAKRLGIHPIYVDEIEEFNETTKEWRRFNVWNLME